MSRQKQKMSKIGPVVFLLLVVVGSLIWASLTVNKQKQKPTRIDTPSVQFEQTYFLSNTLKGPCGEFVLHDKGKFTIYRNNRGESFPEAFVNVNLAVTGQPSITYHADGTVTIKIQKSQAPCLRQKFATHSVDDPGNDPSNVIPRQ